MRTSILSRSVIAVASLAIGSVALVATPATAATSNGITRAEVLAVAAGLRADGVSGAISPANQAALDQLASKGCGLKYSETGQVFGSPVRTPDSVDGLIVTAFVPTTNVEGVTESEASSVDSCSFAVVAPLDSTATLSGDLNVRTVLFDDSDNFPTTISHIHALSNDVFTSPAVTAQNSVLFTAADAVGLVTGPTSLRVLTTTKIADTKTTADKKAAKKQYQRRVTAAKKSYAKALKKAGRSSGKKTTARLAYSARRASAKSAYSYSIANYKLVKVRSSKADARRFSVSSQFAFFS